MVKRDLFSLVDMLFWFKSEEEEEFCEGRGDLGESEKWEAGELAGRGNDAVARLVPFINPLGLSITGDSLATTSPPTSIDPCNNLLPPRHTFATHSSYQDNYTSSHRLNLLVLFPHQSTNDQSWLRQHA
jgi:hypothetical protein